MEPKSFSPLSLLVILIELITLRQIALPLDGILAIKVIRLLIHAVVEDDAKGLEAVH